MYSSRLNFPINASMIGALVADHADLKLMWPDAEIPFNESQWREKIDPETGTLSYWLTRDFETCGHFALKHAAGDPQVWLVYVYLRPEVRGTDASKALIEQAERLATDVMFGETLCLNVRADNAKALKLYSGAGYTEFERIGDLIRMHKSLVPQVEIAPTA